jgi:hypothetical protein
MQMDAAENFKVPTDKTINLKTYDSGWLPKWAQKEEDKEGKKAVKEQALAVLEGNTQKLVKM